MYCAPSVSYPVGRCRFEALLAFGFTVLGAVLLMGWAIGLPSAADALGPGAILPVWLTCTCVAGRGWWRSPAGRAVWDGGAWHWEPAQPAGRRCDGTFQARTAPVKVILDLQAVLLVRLEPVGRWLWLERWRQPALWADVRRAVYSRAATDDAPQHAVGGDPPVP